MGKSIRSKIKKRLRTVKRQRVDAMLVAPREEEHYQSLQKVIEGRSVKLARPKNAFKYPDAEGAVFAQHELMKPIDFRAQNLPMAGYAFRGNRRKYQGEQAEFMTNLAKSSHPEMEVLAGGGAVLAKTGKKVSKYEAAIIATSADRPEVAALAESGPSKAACAVAAAVAQDDAESEEADQTLVEPEDMTEADHLRRPLVKDTRKAQRNRPRSNAVKKKTKVLSRPDQQSRPLRWLPLLRPVRQQLHRPTRRKAKRRWRRIRGCAS